MTNGKADDDPQRSREGSLAGESLAGNCAEFPTLPPKRTAALETVPSSAAVDSMIMSQLGNYELLEEIARGGMGVVYRARQIKLNRIVAVKMILAGQLASAEAVQRFHTEADAAANLDHPGIVPIFEVGEQDRQHYFSMAFVDGESLADRLKRGPLPPREAAMLLLSVAEAVQHAHEKGVIHRDLKPANVLLERLERVDGEVRSDSDSQRLTLPYRPRITDFGVAKRMKSDSQLTGSGDVVGTPSYMPPEQAAGRIQEIRETADVYALGAILYACLTGRPPHQAATPFDTLLQVLDADPAPPRLLNTNVPRDLEAVCLKCLDKEPTRRYSSAQRLVDELQRFLDGESIQAASVNLLDRVLVALRKNRHEENFRGWGLGLISFGLVILVAHAATYMLEAAGHGPLIAYWVPRTLMIVVLLGLLWSYRHQSLWPTNSAERLIWVVWIGYLVSVVVVSITLSASGLDDKLLYAFSAILSGLGFLVMGVHVWGGAYVIGVAFLSAAPLLGAFVRLSSLVYGFLWGAALLAFGFHYWRLARLERG